MKSERRIVLSVMALIVLAIALAAWSTRTSASDSADRIAQDPRALPTDTNTSPASSTHEDLGFAAPGRVEVIDDVVRWTLLGRVVDDQHKPMREFGVRAVRRSELGIVLEEREWPVSEHSDGAFALENLTPGAWEIAPFAPRFALLMSRRFYEPETARPEYRLMPWGLVRGVVLDPTGAPVPYARVHVKTAVVAQADEFGHFEFALAPSEVLLRGESTEFCSSAGVALAITRERELDGVVLTLGWPGELRVHLSDASGAPLENWRVKVASKAGPALLESHARTDREGRATLRLTQDGVLTCSIADARAVDQGSYSFEVECGGIATLDLSQPAGPPVRIRLRVSEETVQRAIERFEQTPSTEPIGLRLGFRRQTSPRDDGSGVLIKARSLERPARLHPTLRARGVEGQFELLLPSAGPWEFTLATDADFRVLEIARIELDIPAQAEFEFDWRE